MQIAVHKMKYFWFFLFVSTYCVTQAQTGNQAIITDLYQRASQFYEEDKLTECLTLLEKVQQLSSTPDAKVLYLKIKSLYALSQKEEKFKPALLQSFPVFLEVAQAQKYPSSKIQEVLAIRQTLENSQQAERAQKEFALQNVIRQIEEQMVFVEGETIKWESLKPKQKRCTSKNSKILLRPGIKFQSAAFISVNTRSDHPITMGSYNGQ